MRLHIDTLFLCALFVGACRAPHAQATGSGSERERTAVAKVLDDFHRAASVADGPRYLGHLADDAVFLGTDATERWTKPEFRAFCEPYFAKGIGWTYEPRERNVAIDDDYAWFDERLFNAKYGDCRGVGVLRKQADEWKIVQYDLSLAVPNDVAGEVVKVIRAKQERASRSH